MTVTQGNLGRFPFARPDRLDRENCQMENKISFWQGRTDRKI